MLEKGMDEEQLQTFERAKPYLEEWMAKLRDRKAQQQQRAVGQ
jgi:hypothetical protein